MQRVSGKFCKLKHLLMIKFAIIILNVFHYFTNFNRYGHVLTPTPIVYSHILQEEGSFTFHQNVQGQIGIMILGDLGGKMSHTALAGCLGKPERFE